jgi:hypothetical protein
MSADGLYHQLTVIARAVEEARSFQRDHNLTSHDTRRLPGNALHAIHAWQKHIAAAVHGGTVELTDATAPFTGSQAGEVVATSSSARELPEVPIAPTVSIRVPADLRVQAEAFGRERRWTFGEVVRVGLERLVDYDGEPEADTGPRPAA